MRASIVFALVLAACERGSETPEPPPAPAVRPRTIDPSLELAGPALDQFCRTHEQQIDDRLDPPRVVWTCDRYANCERGVEGDQHDYWPADDGTPDHSRPRAFALPITVCRARH